MLNTAFLVQYYELYSPFEAEATIFFTAIQK